MPETMIRPAHSAQEIGEHLIHSHHPHLKDAKLLWLFTSAKRMKDDNVRLGSASRAGVLQRYLTSALLEPGAEPNIEDGADFIVLISERQYSAMTMEQRRAFVDHQLCHCGQKERVSRRGKVTRSWYRRGHDIEEFSEVVRRHGLWLPRQTEFISQVPTQRVLELEQQPEPAGSDGEAGALVEHGEVLSDVLAPKRRTRRPRARA